MTLYVSVFASGYTTAQRGIAAVHVHAYAHAARPCPCCMSMLPVYRLYNSGLRNMQRFVRVMCKQSLLLCCFLSDGQDHGANGQPPEGHSGQGLQQFQWQNEAMVEVTAIFF